MPLHAHPKPLWTQQCKAGCVNHPMQERYLKSPAVWHQIIHYDEAGEQLEGKGSYQAKVAEVAKQI